MTMVNIVSIRVEQASPMEIEPWNWEIRYWRAGAVEIMTGKSDNYHEALMLLIAHTGELERHG